MNGPGTSNLGHHRPQFPIPGSRTPLTEFRILKAAALERVESVGDASMRECRMVKMKTGSALTRKCPIPLHEIFDEGTPAGINATSG
jgi:hypothetical protein